MKKYLAVILSLVLALAMVFSLVGCNIETTNDDDDDDESKASSSQSESDESDDEDKSSDDEDASSKENDDKITTAGVVGDWEATLDLTETLVSQLSKDPDNTQMLEYVDFGDMSIKFFLELDANNKAKMYVDEEEFINTMQELFRDVVDGMIDMLKTEGANGMTFDQLLEQSNMTEAQFREQIDSMLSEMFNDDTIKDQLCDEGTYELNGNKLTLTDTDGEILEGEYKNGKIYIEDEGVTIVFERA